MSGRHRAPRLRARAVVSVGLIAALVSGAGAPPRARLLAQAGAPSARVAAHAPSAASTMAVLPPASPLGSPLEYRTKLEEVLLRGEWLAGLALYEQCTLVYGRYMSAVTRADLVSTAVSGLTRLGRVRPACTLLLAALDAEGSAGKPETGQAMGKTSTHALLDACASTPGHMREAQAIVRALLAQNSPAVDAKAYCLLIKGFGRNADVRGVGSTLRGMRAAGVRPDLITCNAALDAYARAGAPDDARALLRKMEESAAAAGGGGAAEADARASLEQLPRPTVRSFNTVLKAYARAGRSDDARALAVQMLAAASAAARPAAVRSAQATLGTAAFNGDAALDAALAAPPADADDVGGGGGLAASARQPAAVSRAEPCFNQISLNTLIDAHARAGELDAALALLHDGAAVVAALPAARAAGAGALAAPPAAAAPARSGAVRASAHAYTSVLVALARGRRLPDALVLFATMRARGVVPTATTFNCLIAACARSGDDARAEALLAQMRAEGGGVAPDVETYNALISGLCRSAHVRADALERVLALVREMEELGLRADARTFNSLLGALARRADGKGAEAIAARMEGAGLELTVHSYSALMQAHGAAGELGAVVRAFERLCASGQPLDALCWNEYLRALLQADARAAGASGGGVPRQRGTLEPGAELALAALEQMRRGVGAEPRALPCGVVSYSILVHGLARTRAGAREAWRLYGRMKAEGVEVDEPCARALMIACKRFVGVEAAAELLADLAAAGWSERALEPLESELRQIEATASFTTDEQWKAREARSPSLQPPIIKRDALFERHGWGEFDSGFRML